MSKRPSFQFYPPDWRRDADLRLCSMAARGLWIDMLCLMHEGEPYGHLTAHGRPMKPEQLAKLVGEPAASVKRWLAELADHEVFSVTEDGLVFSRRMVRDEQVREARALGGHAGAAHGAKGAEHGAKGGRPKKVEGGADTETRGDNKPPLEPPPSSSSPSSQGSEDESSGVDDAEPGFDPDKATWEMGVKLLRSQGRASESAARGFIGKLLKDRPGLVAKDLLPAVTGALANKTGDPQAYLTRAADGIAKRRGEHVEPKRVGFV
ncbi:hypothetical protein [Phenylobacterium sp.]|uniref:hypothetical protein n=1 Tax=Phenylobacterium sp. TaxID=1871053 RepID=UPI002FC8485D